MPQSESKFTINQFTAGLVTDANPLADTGPVSINEDNCEIVSHGGRRRRRGARLEPGFNSHTVTLTTAQRNSWAFETFEWPTVADVSGLEFLIYQQGSTLWFYDKSLPAISQGLKTFSVNLLTFKTATASNADVESTRVSVATGKGAAFVCSSAIEPFYIEYNPDSDTITTTQINIEIRDFEEQSPTIGPQDEIAVGPGIKTTPEHFYDLLNQGWYQIGPWNRADNTTIRGGIPVIVLYLGEQDVLPKKNTPWHIGKYIVATNNGDSNTFISPQSVRSSPSGNTLAPFGHYILNAFNKDRFQAIADENDFSAEFAIADPELLVPDVRTERPATTTFYAGRAWYFIDNELYFSQQLDEDSLNKAGRCYQEGDPTNEGESDVVATDGGVVTIADMGRVVGVAKNDIALIVFADNGIWAVTGSGGSSFNAVDFSVIKLSNISVQSPSSIVEAEGLIFFWAENGIHVLQPGELRDVPQLQNLVEQRITEFYNNIPQSSKRNVKGIYDPREKIIHWMYKSQVGDGTDVNRFAYDRFLNFSLKFSAFFPWSVDATNAKQIIGGTVTEGVLTTAGEETVTDSSGTDVTISTGETVTINTTTSSEVSERFKVLVLNDLNATFGEFQDYSYLDWNEAGAGANYSSFIETFYHIQDDTMAFMQAPYVYTFFRRTEETPVTLIENAFTFDDFTEGGLTFNSELISERETADDTAPNLHSQSTFLIGPDGTRYNFHHPGVVTDPVFMYNVDTGARTPDLDLDRTRFNADAAATAPPGGHWEGNFNTICAFIVPNTRYMIIIGTDTGLFTGVSKAILYYRINDNSNGWDFVDGYGGRTDTVSGGNSTQFSPADTQTEAYRGLGWVNNVKTELPSGNALASAQNNIYHQYPIAVTWEGNARSTIFILPSLNYATLGAIEGENTSFPWFNREINLNESQFFGTDSIYRLNSSLGGSGKNTRAFILPTSNGARYFVPFFKADIDQHIAGTASPASSFLTTHAPTYPDGLMSSIDITAQADAANAFGFDRTASNRIIPAQNFWPQYPFSDESDNFDGTAGSAAVNYHNAPGAYPIYEDNIEGPWVVLWPKVYNQIAADRNKLGVKTYIYNPLTRQAKFIGEVKGTLFEATDVGLDFDIEQVALHWNNANGDITATLRRGGPAISSSALTTVKIGTYIPQVAGLGNLFDFQVGDTLAVPSGCIMNTRWDWANAAASGKVSADIQVYRIGRTQFVDNPALPNATGLPVYVSKTKTRGRGRALQLRFRSETGKDFELYGWAVWSRKNTRF